MLLDINQFSHFCMHCIWASSWDYGIYRIGDQRRLRRACTSTQSRQSLHCLHTLNYGSRGRVQPKIRHLAPLDVCTCMFEEWIYWGREVPLSHEMADLETAIQDSLKHHYSCLRTFTESNNKEMLKILKTTNKLFWKARAVTLHILRMTIFFTYPH